MSHLKLHIDGDYWDSHIYAGRLYLFTSNGSIQTYDWDKLIHSIDVPQKLRLALYCAFRRGDYFYGAGWKPIFDDTEIRSIIVEKFNQLSKLELHVSQRKLAYYRIHEQDVPFPFPHANATIYMRNFFSVGSSGLYRSSCNKQTKFPVSTKPEKLWDCPVQSLAASYGAIALAAGNEGLWEYQFSSKYDLFDPLNDQNNGVNQLSQWPCDTCEYMYYSVFGSSYSHPGYLASYERDNTEGHVRRNLKELISDEQILPAAPNAERYSFGARDKIYMASPGRIDIIRYEPWAEHEPLEILEPVHISAWKGELISGGVATFGVILEYENALVILPSEGHPKTLKGEPVRWRVFPRSKFYENHLHVIGDDQLTIHSFSHDYFVEQETKLFGSMIGRRSLYLSGRN